MIILIDNYDSFTYNLYQMIAEHQDVKVIRNDAMSVDEILALKPSGIILSPGPKAPRDAGICLELIKKCPANIPIFGVCLGYQAIGEAYGAKVIPASKIVHGKSTLIFHEGKGLFQKMPLPFKAARYHSLVVDKTTLPKCFQIIAENELGDLMAIKHESKPLYGVQFHPESIITQSGEIMLKTFLDHC